ncbi:phosphotransferase enzyme family protein [Mucilaginibacter arboris]|uniref:Phosphotransferase n=1 Tax=Mucilaginibacter arboris TaxID=2682090 RepID=A0A7K1ST54_9SPHI|nr:aminoglycoside phosphotransferase family protein [Mucilaginibacter arboris]MVN20496.1 phosphotransferase [Mucilaginibacter arboris]
MKQETIKNNNITYALTEFGLEPEGYEVKKFGSGLINYTWKLTGSKGSYILQQINDTIFKRPEDIADNIRKLQIFLQQTVPEYLFVAPVPSLSNKYLIQSEDGSFYRLLPFIQGSHTVDYLQHQEQAYEAAVQFGKFTRLLKDFDLKQLKYTLQDFHNLSLRFEEFKTSCAQAGHSRLERAKKAVEEVFLNMDIARIYGGLISNGEIPLRVVHHDTKINNVLFDGQGKGLCVIDLDTVMPGFYLSDAGDMLRTCLSPANEEESDLAKIHIREDFFMAIYNGYMKEMGEVLTPKEKGLFIYSGKMMIYLQALRFLTDFLNGDKYYHITYPEQNLIRASNQFELLRQYNQQEDRFLQLIG